MAISNLKLCHRISACNFTAEQWDLYLSHKDAPTAAGILNAQLTFWVNQGNERGEVRRRMEIQFQRFAAVGANDTEPSRFLERVLDHIYGEG